MSIPLGLPAEDRASSPYTGYTRAHWEAVADGLTTAAWRWSTPGDALLDLPGRPSRSGTRSDGLEGYARTFLATAFRVAGAAGTTRTACWSATRAASPRAPLRPAVTTRNPGR